MKRPLLALVTRLILFAALLILAMAIAGLYGVAHDQLTFTIGPEYFTRFKYVQFGFTHSALPDRMKVAIIGFLASWWMGIPIGWIVGGLGLIHRSPSLIVARTLKAYGVVVGVTLLVGLSGLLYGWFFASHLPSDYPNWWIPENLTDPGAFLTVGFTHNFTYLGGALGLIAGVLMQVWQRDSLKTAGRNGSLAVS